MAGVLPGFLTASLAPRIADDFAFGGTELGLAVATFYAVCAIGSTPAGRLVDRVGASSSLRLAATSTAIGSIAVAAGARSALALTLCLVIAGIGNALGGPAVSVLLRGAVAGRRHGVAFGIQQAGAPLGALAAGVSLPAIAIPLGWRWGFVIPAVLALGAGELAARGAGRRAPAGRPASAPHPTRTADVRMIGAAAVLASAAGVGMVAFLVVYAVERGMSESAAGVTLGVVSLGAAVSRIGLGWASDRRRDDPLVVTAAMLAVSAAGYGVIAAGSPPAIVAGAILVGTVGWAWPGTFTLAVVQRAPQAPAWAVGVMMSGLFAGAVAGPLVIGLLADAGAFAAAWAACAGCAVAAAGVTMYVAGRAERNHDGSGSRRWIEEEST